MGVVAKWGSGGRDGAASDLLAGGLLFSLVKSDFSSGEFGLADRYSLVELRLRVGALFTCLVRLDANAVRTVRP